MGITCPCCGLKFIVCAAHLTPDQRTVQCFNCATRWPMVADGTAAPRAATADARAEAQTAASGRLR